MDKVIDCSAKLFAPMSKTPAPVGSPYAFIIAYDAKCPYCAFVMHETLDSSISIHGGLQLNPVNRCEHFVAAVIESENDAQGNPKLLKVMVGFNEQKITDAEMREEKELADMGLGDYLQGIERDEK